MKSLKKNAVLYLILAILLVAGIIPCQSVNAATLSYPDQYLEIEIPDNVLVMTPNTPKSDEVWQRAGVANVTAKLKEFSQMGVVAAYYNPETKLNVSFIFHRNADTIERFTFRGMSDSEIEQYVSGLMEATGAQIDVSVFYQDSFPFYRLEIFRDDSTATGREIIYGTMVNGQMLQFDTYNQGSSALDESFLKTVVGGIHIEREITREDYDILVQNGLRRFGLTIGCIVGFVVLLIVIAIINQRHRKRKSAQIGEALVAFRERRQSGAVSENSAPVYSAGAEYSKEAFEKLNLFTIWFKNLPQLIIIIVGCAALIWMLMNNQSILSGLALLVAGLVILYARYSMLESKGEKLMKRYTSNGIQTASYAFFEEHFEVRGLNTSSEYIYPQITEIRTFDEYIYLYLGDNQVYIIDKSTVESPSGLTAFLKSHRK